MRCTSFNFMSHNIVTVLYSSTAGKLQPVITESFLLTKLSYLQLCSQCKVFLNETSSECWIGQGGPLNWLAHSPKLIAMDFSSVRFSGLIGHSAWWMVCRIY